MSSDDEYNQNMIQLKQIYQNYYIQYFLDDNQNVTKNIQDEFNQKFKDYLKEQNKDELIRYFERWLEKSYMSDFGELKCVMNLMISKKIKLNENQSQNLEKRLKRIYCKDQKIEYTDNIDNKYQNNQNRYTVAMWLTSCGFIIPRQWMHNYDIKNIYSETLLDMIKIKGLPYPENWENESKMSFFDQAYFGIVPDIANHEVDGQYEDGWTIAMLLALNDVDVPKQWWHDSEIVNDYGYTVAMLYAMNDTIPPGYWEHEPEIQQIYGWTVAMFLAYNGILPSEQWLHDPKIQNKHGSTVATILAETYGMPPQEWEHDPQIHDDDGDTVAILLLKCQNIMPSRDWMHNINYSNDRCESIGQLLQRKQLPIPQKWGYYEILSAFDRAIFQEKPNFSFYLLDGQNRDGWTVAMILALNNMEIEQNQYHDPSIQNRYGYTVAMILAMNGKIPDKQWQHNKYLRCHYNNGKFYTVQNILQEKNIEVPEEWRYDILNEDEDNQAMIDAKNGIIPELGDNYPSYQNKNGETVSLILSKNGIIPPLCWIYEKNQYHNNYVNNYTNLIDNLLPYYQVKNKNEELSIFDQACNRTVPNINGHSPDEQNEDGFTVAMILAINNIQIPKEWEHKPDIQNHYRMTVAMYQARNKIMPPKQWEHDPLIQNQSHYTVGLFLISRGILPPEQWQTIIDRNQEVVSFVDVRIWLYQNGYKKQGKYIVAEKYSMTQVLDDMCQICFNEGKQEFIKTTCGHAICYDCFQQLVESNDISKCPICRRKKWYKYNYFAYYD